MLDCVLNLYLYSPQNTRIFFIKAAKMQYNMCKEKILNHLVLSVYTLLITIDTFYLSLSTQVADANGTVSRKTLYFINYNF